MELPLRSPMLTAVAVAVAGAGLIAVAPAAPPPTAPPSTTPAPQAVQLTGAGDLITPYVDLITNTFDNLKAIGVDRFADPVPVLAQIFTNQVGYGDALWSALLSGDFHGVLGAFDDAARGMTQNLLNVIHTVTSTAVGIDLSHLLPPEDDLLPSVGAIISAILSGNFHDIIAHIIGEVGTADLNLGMPLALLVDAIGAPYFGITASLDSAGDFFHELFGGQFGAAFTTAFTAPATIADAFLNGSGVPIAQLLSLFGVDNLAGSLPPIDLGSLPVDIPLIGHGTAHLGEITVQGINGTLPLGGLLAPLGHVEVGAGVEYSGGQVDFDPICIFGICHTPSPITIAADPDIFDVTRTLGGTPLGGLLPALVNWAPQQLAAAISAPVTSSWADIGTQFKDLPGYLWDQLTLSSIFGEGGLLDSLPGLGGAGGLFDLFPDLGVA